jgi:hypothetical protein
MPYPAQPSEGIKITIEMLILVQQHIILTTPEQAVNSAFIASEDMSQEGGQKNYSKC